MFFKTIAAIPTRQILTKTFGALERLHNPVVGNKLLDLVRPGYYVRIDGRSIFDLQKEGGFGAVLTSDGLSTVTRSDVENYQEFNTPTFGIGACSTMQKLTGGFIKDHSVMARGRLIYGFYGQGVSLLQVRMAFFGEGSSRDHEHEYVVLEPVPAHRFLFATETVDREVFESGLLVPNAMKVVNPDLPVALSKEDVEDLPSIFAWLIKNGSEKTAKEFGAYVLRHDKPDFFSRQLGGDKRLIGAVQSLLKDTAEDDDYIDCHGPR